jgi:hypothetical protein
MYTAGRVPTGRDTTATRPDEIEAGAARSLGLSQVEVETGAVQRTKAGLAPKE